MYAPRRRAPRAPGSVGGHGGCPRSDRPGAPFMPRLPRRLFATLLALVLLAPGCALPRRGAPWHYVAEQTPPFLMEAEARAPALAVDDAGRLALTWVTSHAQGADAWISVSADSGANWSEPSRLNEREGRVSSFPESRPVAAWGPNGMLVAAWAAARGTQPFADD